MSEWQDISTAPRDGTVHLRWSIKHGAIVCNEPLGYRAGQWGIVNGGWRGMTKSAAHEATHWMPLPPPPNEP